MDSEERGEEQHPEGSPAGPETAAEPEVAKEQRTAYLPFLLEGFGDKAELFQPDRIHPVESAQPIIVDNVWRALKPLLKK